jgi:hypothetical protein
MYQIPGSGQIFYEKKLFEGKNGKDANDCLNFKLVTVTF